MYMNNIEEIKPFMTAKECAKILKVTHQTIWRAINGGQLKAFRVGQKRFRIKEEDFKNYLNNLSYSRGLPKEKILEAINTINNN